GPAVLGPVRAGRGRGGVVRRLLVAARRARTLAGRPAVGGPGLPPDRPVRELAVGPDAHARAHSRARGPARRTRVGVPAAVGGGRGIRDGERRRGGDARDLPRSGTLRVGRPGAGRVPALGRPGPPPRARAGRGGRSGARIPTR